MQCLARKITSLLIQKHIITPELAAVYQYGFEILFSTMFTSISILFISCLMDSLFIGLLYFLVAIPLRMTGGGYHADTYRKCFFISSLAYIILSCTNKLLSLFDIPNFIWILLLLTSTMYIWHKAPIKNIHHPVSKRILSRNKKFCITFLILDCSILIPLLMLIPQSSIVHFAVLSVLSVALFIIPAQKKGGVSYDNADSLKACS